MKMLPALLVVFLFGMQLAVRAQNAMHKDAELPQMEVRLQRAAEPQERLKLLLELGVEYEARDTSKTLLVKGFNYVSEAIVLSKKLQAYDQLADAYLLYARFSYAKSELKHTKQYIDAAMALFVKQGNYLQVGNAYILKWQTAVTEGADYTARIAILEKAPPAFHNCGDKFQEANCYKELGDLYLIKGELTPALISLRKALELYGQIKYVKTQSIYDLLGKAYLRMGDYRSAVECGLKAVAISLQLGDSSISLATCYNRLGSTYSQIGDHVHSEANYRKALAIDMRYNDTSDVFYIAYNVTNELLSQNKNAEAYHFFSGLKKKYPTLGASDTVALALLYTHLYGELGQFKKGAPYCNALEAMANEKDANDNLQPYLYFAIIPFYIASNNPEKAQVFASRFKKFNESSNTVNGWSLYYELQFQIDSARGDYKAAMDHYQKSVALKDSLFNETKSYQINELNVLFDSEKKNKDLMLLKRDADLQASRVRRAALLRNITILSLVLVSAVLIALWRGYRRKQRSSRLLEQKQEEIEHKSDMLEQLVVEKDWLVKEIHHRVKNNLHMVSGLLASQTEFLQGEEALNAITESQSRVEAMAIIHQRLYQTDNLSAIDMSSYIGELVDNLKYSGTGNDVHRTLDIDPVRLPLSHSVPIGLIINEAVSNALKYAFPAVEKPMVTVSLKATTDNGFTLTITDNGKGMPGNFDPDHITSFGMTLMKGLAHEIGASFRIISDQGTRVTASFRL